MAAVLRLLRWRRRRAPVLRLAALGAGLDTALERRRSRRGTWQKRARKGAATKFRKRMEGARR